MLARVGLAVSRTSVQSFLRRPPKKPAVEDALDAKYRRRCLIAKRPGHLWFLDFTRVGGFFRSVRVNAHRPHQGLGQRTPDEVYFGRDTRARSVPLRRELVAELLDGDRLLPVLRLRRAA